MGLSIGVVSVRYLEEPPQPIIDFITDLRTLSSTGLEDYYRDLDDRDEDDPLGDDDDDDECWEDGGFCEFRRIGLVRRASGWAIRKRLTEADKALLLGWIANLSWNDDYIMLHLGH